MTLWRKSAAGWIPKATNTHSEYAIIITFPLQQWLHERASLLHYTHIFCLVVNKLKCSEVKKVNNSNANKLMVPNKILYCC
jgi:hypothetical protein